MIFTKQVQIMFVNKPISHGQYLVKFQSNTKTDDGELGGFLKSNTMESFVSQASQTVLKGITHLY